MWTIVRFESGYLRLALAGGGYWCLSGTLWGEWLEGLCIQALHWQQELCGGKASMLNAKSATQISSDFNDSAICLLDISSNINEFKSTSIHAFELAWQVGQCNQHSSVGGDSMRFYSTCILCICFLGNFSTHQGKCTFRMDSEQQYCPYFQSTKSSVVLKRRAGCSPWIIATSQVQRRRLCRGFRRYKGWFSAPFVLWMSQKWLSY